MGLLSSLPDQLLLTILSLAPPSTLGSCACVCHALRAFALSEELWKAIVLESLPDGQLLTFRRSWRHTFLSRTQAGGPTSIDARLTPPPLYSDDLFAPWFCGTATIPPSWYSLDNVPRVDGSNLSADHFEAEYIRGGGRPVVLTNVASQWEASEWSEPSLRRRFGGRAFHVGGHSMRLSDFFDYCHATTDEMPLYLFDKQFASAAPTLAREYTPPPIFSAEHDLFSTLPPSCRPDFRWLIIGPPRSGSSWHVDPNASCAWNACLSGRKKWILCPPNHPPPGVTASEDGSSVTSPISLYEWFRVFYSSLHSEPPSHPSRSSHTTTPTPVEVTLEAGEILFVPQGWWHTALNLTTTIAITQNLVPRCTAHKARNPPPPPGRTDIGVWG
ncbi:MAG: hypothetical protein SGPRY_010779 [Prymnesium sp.]